MLFSLAGEVPLSFERGTLVLNSKTNSQVVNKLNKKLKVLIIAGIFPPDIGGPATYVSKIATSLAERGHEITVITLSDRLDHNDREYPFRVVRIPRKMFKPWRMFQTIRAILRFGREADVLFVNGLALEAVLANKFLRKPLVMKVVGDFAWERATSRGWTKDDFETFQSKRYDLKIELLKALRAWWTRQAHQIIVPSKYLAKWIQDWGVPEERITVIYNALEPMDSVKPLPVPLSTPVKAVTVGRLISLKRVDKILEAVARIPELGLVVIGDGPERPRLEQQAVSLGISERVYFAGQRSHEETLRLMASCDFLVLNSIHEGLPHVVLEAMALGLPVVATAVGGTPEVVKDGETGVLVEVKTNKLEVELLRLVKDKKIRILFGKKAKRQAFNLFSLNSMIDKTEQILINAKEGKRLCHLYP